MSFPYITFNFAVKNLYSAKANFAPPNKIFLFYEEDIKAKYYAKDCTVEVLKLLISILSKWFNAGLVMMLPVVIVFLIMKLRVRIDNFMYLMMSKVTVYSWELFLPSLSVTQYNTLT